LEFIKNMGCLVSIIIPTYNAAHLLPRAIESALGQTFLDTEIIVVDDGSIDDTAGIAQRYSARVKYIYIAHAGLPAVTRNAGLKLAKGEYIAFLDADDAWLPEKLEKQLALMRQNDCLASSTNAWRVREGESDRSYFPQPLPEQLTFHNLLVTNLVICSSAIVHHSIFRATGHFPGTPTLKAMEDYALWLRVATQTNWAYLSEPLVRYSDMPSLSIRSNGVSQYEQNRWVLRDFKTWAKNACVSRSFQWQVQKRLLSNTLAEARHSLRSFLPAKKT
jgi:teichuronic acid biosynthesis glycosyltransferase TuaG